MFFQGFQDHLPEQLPVQPGDNRLFVGLGNCHGVSLPLIALLHNQSVSEGHEPLV